MMKKFIKFIVKKCWKNPAFREAVSDCVKESPVRFFHESFGKVYTVKNDVIVLHEDNVIPYIYTSPEEVISAASQFTTKPVKKPGRKKKRDDSVAKKTV